MVAELVGADLGAAVPAASIDALCDRLLAELDYRAEAGWLRRFRLAFGSDPAVVIPQVYPAYSGSRVLCMERLVGRSLPQVAASTDVRERSAVAATLFRFAMAAPLRGIA